MNRLEEESRVGKAGTLAAQLSRLDLVVLDELGYLPFASSGGRLLFHLVSKLYERTAATCRKRPRVRPRSSYCHHKNDSDAEGHFAS